VEALKGVELTDTNRPCGLTTKYSSIGWVLVDPRIGEVIVRWPTYRYTDCGWSRLDRMLGCKAALKKTLIQLSRKSRCSDNRRRNQFSVAIAEVKHPFPSRTRQLSPPAPMVLCPKAARESRTRPGNFKGGAIKLRPFSFLDRQKNEALPLSIKTDWPNRFRHDQ
jgi:hypothetical protein